jgi:hypothetical protein
MLTLFRFYYLFLLLTCVALCTGCPSTKPPSTSEAPGEHSADRGAKQDLKQDADAVAALKAAGATLTANSDGHITAVELNRDTGGDAELAFLKGMP